MQSRNRRSGYLGCPVVVLAILALDLAPSSHASCGSGARRDHRLRFHPPKILVSMVIKMATVLLVGAPALAVRVFEALLNATSLFNHGNIRLPWWERLFRTYRAQPEKRHLGMALGIEDFRTEHDLRLDQMLIQPFLNNTTNPTHLRSHHDTGTV